MATLPIKTGKWVKATKVKVSKSGKIQLMVPGSSLKKNPRSKRKNVAAGFYDEDGYFHPLRASFDYSASRAGEKAKRKPAKKKRKVKAKGRKR